MNKHIIFAILISFVGIMVWSAGLTKSITEYDGSLGTTSIEEVECYDKYGNEIKELKCEEEVIDYDMTIILPLVFGTITIAVGMLYLFGTIIRNDANGGKDE